MSKGKNLFVMGMTAFWGALLYTIGWGLVNWLTSVPSTYDVVIGSFSISINRWFDVILFSICLNMIQSVYLWLFPILERRGIKYDNLGVGLITGLFGGLLVGLVAGFVVGFVVAPGLVLVVVLGAMVGTVPLAIISAQLGFGINTEPTAALGAVLGVALGAGLVAGFVTALVVVLGLVLVTGLVIGLAYLVKKIVELHKKAFRQIK